MPSYPFNQFIIHEGLMSTKLFIQYAAKFLATHSTSMVRIGGILSSLELKWKATRKMGAGKKGKGRGWYEN